MQNNQEEQLSFGGHLEVLRQMILRILAVITSLAVLIFIFKDTAWRIILAPGSWDFITYRLIEQIAQIFNAGFQFGHYEVALIATELSSQFMMHITTSVYLGCLGASPYILYEVFRFVLPALYENEKKKSLLVAITIYILFFLGVFISYFLIFPISFRFLGTYSVADKVNTMITLSSYITTFTSLTLILGIVFQLPILIYILTKLSLVNQGMLIFYRKYAFFAIVFLSALITPPDIMSCLIVSTPLYLLYECSILISKYASIKRKDGR
ncbi:MAG: twin-arginine translocase subunit TatC [Alistipes sp.]|nr:twin-arginine translocase subunit TatC [Alistipes sp.]